MKNRKKAFKAILAALFLGITMTGCSNHDKPATDPNGDVADSKETKDSDQKEFVMPTEVMSKEETDALTEGQTISAEELKKLPDPLALENRGLAFVYVYNVEISSDNSKKVQYAYGKTIDNIVPVDQLPCYDFANIQILPIDEYIIMYDDSQWYKLVTFNGDCVDAGPVLSEEKIQELNASQK